MKILFVCYSNIKTTFIKIHQLSVLRLTLYIQSNDDEGQDNYLKNISVELKITFFLYLSTKKTEKTERLLAWI